MIQHPSMLHIRHPAVAGTFYPQNADRLRAMIRDFLQQAHHTQSPSADRIPKAMILPHAGYIYSGPIAASGYVHLEPARDRVKRVVMLGPAHRVPFTGIATSSADGWLTPLGQLSVDRKACEKVGRLPFVGDYDAAHLMEHSLEVHVPFIQEVLGPVEIVPMVFGRCDADQIAQTLDLLWDGNECFVLVSSDLSHYHEYSQARRIDEATRAAIEALQPDQLETDQACGCLAIQGLLTLARHRGLKARTLDQRNSGDTAGTREEVVGYGAYAFGE